MEIYVSPGHADALHIEPGALEPLITEIVWFDYSVVSSSYSAEPHLHHYHQLDIVLDGEFTLTVEGRDDQVGHAGDAWLVPPLLWHGVHCANPFRYCSFKFHLAPQFWRLCGPDFRRFRVPEHLLQSIAAFGQRSVALPPLAGQHAAAIIALCFIELNDRQAQVESEEDDLNEFRHALWPLLENIRHEPSIKWSVARMAQALSLSPDYFSRRFRHALGQTPQRFILETVMRQSAAELLKVPAPPIKLIAERAGYANVQAFTHAFTHVFKVSPAAYRRQSAHRAAGRF